MTDLREAAQAVLDRWDSPAWEWLKQGPTAALMSDLRAALAEPMQEQPTCDECGRRKADGWALYCVDCLEPMFAQRKPLTDEEIIDLWEGVSDPESPEISMIDFARAIERAHGIGGGHV